MRAISTTSYSCTSTNKTPMKQIVTAVVAKVAVAAAAVNSVGTRRIPTVIKYEPQPAQHRLLSDRLLQDDASNTVSIGGTAFFDINGNGQLDVDQGDGSINPISNTAIIVVAELWSCDTGKNLGYQLTDENGKYLFTVPAEQGRACYYVRYDSSSMEGSFSCSGQRKCATENLNLRAGQEALDVDVGIRTSDFDTVLAAFEQDVADEDEDTDDEDGWNISSGGLVFEPMTYSPTAVYVRPSRPSPSVTNVPVSSPTEKETTLIPTNSPSALSTANGAPADSEEQATSSSSSSGLIQLNSQIHVMLSNIESTMDDNSLKLFEDVCDTFLNEQLAIAVPPISYIKCAVIDQSVISGRKRLRNLEQVESIVGSTLEVEVDVTGVALPTRNIKTKEQVQFENKLAGAFKTQGDQFVRLLKKEEAKVVTDFNEAMFPALSAVKVVGVAEGNVITTKENSGSSVAMIAGIAAGGAGLLALVILFVVRYRSKQREQQQDLKTSGSKETASSISPTAGYFPTPFQSNTGVEVGRRAVSPTDMSSRVQRNVICPPGKLKVLIANTQGYGPAIHTIKPNSPVEGLLFVGDIIVAVNGTKTRKSKADEITRLLRVTAREERNITVLSLMR